MGRVHARGVAQLLSIGEFSELCGLSPKMLPSYASAGLLTPAAVDSSSGYRYYAPGQVRQATVIAALRHAGVPLADIRSFLEHPTAERLDQWARELESELADRRGALAEVRVLLAVDAAPPERVQAHDHHRGG